MVVYIPSETAIANTIIRNVTKKDISKIVELQKASFPDMEHMV